ncbi:MAG TPA: HD domain-containing protein [Alphaproteobacteria bacterium]|nr:HD domain-containing protein [Alphaproteobacteria bacterium]
MNHIIEFLKTVENLHTEKRALELSNGKKQSVSSHSWMMSIMAMIFAPRLQQSVDLNKVIKLCLLHDLAESKVGDMKLHEQISNSELGKIKQERELKAMNELCALLPESDVGAGIRELWNEYEERKTPESKFVKVLDMLDVCVQLVCTKSLKTWSSYGNGIYPKIYFSEEYKNNFNFDSFTMKLFIEIQYVVTKRFKEELNLTPDDFKE